MEKKTMRGLRMDKGLSLRDLSKLTGITISNLSLIERNMSKPTTQNVHKIAGALGLTYEEMFDILYV